MTRTLHICALALAMLAVGCSAGAGADHTDPNNLVTFKVNDGWTVKSNAKGVRFRHSDSANERTALSVSARERNPKRSLEQQRDIRQSQIQSQGFTVMTDEMRTIGDWDVWESAVQSAPDRNGPIMHTFHLFSADVQAEVTLIAVNPDYANYSPDLVAVVESLRTR